MRPAGLSRPGRGGALRAYGQLPHLRVERPTQATQLCARRRADAVDQYGNTPVLAAAQNGQLAALRLVLAAPGGEEIDHPNNNGQTALMFACQCSNPEVAKLLLERGANKDLRDNDGDGVDYYVNAAEHSQEELRALLARY